MAKLNKLSISTDIEDLGAEILAIESVLTNSEVHIPTSKAVKDSIELISDYIIPIITTETTIKFDKNKIYYQFDDSLSGNIINDLTDAKLGIIIKIYHQDSVEPTFPVNWVKLSGTYIVDTLNIIYSEYCMNDDRVEFWIIQENML